MHTPGPWIVEPYDELGGYDCMYGCIGIGSHITLDGSDYGQKSCERIEPEVLARMESDARLISAAPDLLYALQEFIRNPGGDNTEQIAEDAINKALGENK